MLEALRESFTYYPWWVYVLCAFGAMFLGMGIRWWRDSRKYNDAVKQKEVLRREKSKRKRDRRRPVKPAKKAE